MSAIISEYKLNDFPSSDRLLFASASCSSTRQLEQPWRVVASQDLLPRLLTTHPEIWRLLCSVMALCVRSSVLKAELLIRHAIVTMYQRNRMDANTRVGFANLHGTDATLP
jgi:hypothetical protein